MTDGLRARSAHLPAVFVLTKTGHLAGYSLEMILQRKEHERLYGTGTVWWGIGESLASRVAAFVEHSKPYPPEVVFVPDKKAQAGVSPPGPGEGQIYVWQEYQAGAGLTEMVPADVLVQTGQQQSKRQYALVCKFDHPLTEAEGGEIDLSVYRNYGGQSDQLGTSQVTAVVEYNGKQTQDASKRYPILCIGVLAPPYCVRLANPRVLSAEERERVEATYTRTLSAEEYLALARAIRGG